MTVDQMRNALVEVYSGPVWRMRVSGMDDRQVIAIYKCMQKEGRLNKKDRFKKKEPGIKKAQQLSMWDILDEVKQ